MLQPTLVPPRITPPLAPFDPFNHPTPTAPPPAGAPPFAVPPKAEMPRRRGGRAVALVVGLIVVIALLGGGVYAYYLWQQSRPPVATQPNPPQLFDQAVAAWANVTSYSMAYDFSFTLAAAPGSAYAEELSKQGYTGTSVTGTMNGTAAVALGDNPHGSGKINLSIPLGSGADQLFGGGVLEPVISYVQTDKDTTYFQIDRLPILAKLGLTGVEGTWVKYVSSTTTGATAAGATPEQQALLQQTLTDLKKLYQAHPFLTLTGASGNETEWELTVGLDRAQLKAFVAGLQQLKAAQQAGATIGSAEAAKVQQDLDAVVESLQLQGTLRIGKSDNLFHRIQLALTVAPPADKPDDATMTVRSDIQLSDFNQPVSAVAPATFITAEELSARVMNVVMMGAAPRSDGQPFVTPTPAVVVPLGQLDSDGDGLSDELERAIGTDPIQNDTDGDGYPDKVELRNGYNPLGAGKLPPEIANLLPPNF